MPKKKSAKKIAQPEERKEVKLSGWILTIPTEEPGQWFSRDLSECSVEEFNQWLIYVFPFHDPDSDLSKFESLSVKKRAVKEIAQFHTSQLFVAGPKDSRLEH